MNTPNFPLPANAPRACPACGGPWTYGYVVKKLPNLPGAGRGKRIYKRALECRNDGCGLGYFVGSEITRAETKGLKLIDRESRKKEVLRMAEDERTAKRWAKNYDACVECGRTDQPHGGNGLCKRCHSRKIYRENRERGGNVTKPARKKKAASPGAAPAHTVALPEDLYLILEKIGRISNAKVDDVAAVVIRNYLGDLGIPVGSAGKKP